MKKIICLAMILVFVIVSFAVPVTANDVVYIGWLGPLTEPLAVFGTSVQRGVQLYIDQFNALGGTQIRVIEFDDEGLATRAITGYNYLYTQNVTAIIGSVTSGPTMAVAPLAFEDNMPMITATASHPAVTVCWDTGTVFTNMFRAVMLDELQGIKMADFAAKVAGAQTAAILFSNEIAYSIELAYAFMNRAEALGLEIISVEAFSDDSVDLRPQLRNIAAANPDVLFIPGYIRHMALIGPQSVEVGLTDTVLLGGDGWAGTADFLEGASSLNGSFFLTSFSPENPATRQFVYDYQARHGGMPNMFSAQAFDAAKVLVSAIEWTLQTTSYAPNSEEFQIALIANIKGTDLQGVTGQIIFDEFNNPQKSSTILGIENGREFFWGEFSGAQTPTYTPAPENDNIHVILDGVEIQFDVPPMIIDNRTMVPMRAIFEAFGMWVEWIDDENKITEDIDELIWGNEYFEIPNAEIFDWATYRPIITASGVALQINSYAMFIAKDFLDWYLFQLDVPPMIIDNRTLVPLRAVSEALDAEVQWDNHTRTVTITTK